MTELQKGIRIVGEARQTLGREMRKKYDSGSSVRDLAKEYGRSFGFVHRLMSEFGEMRPRGTGAGARRKK